MKFIESLSERERPVSDMVMQRMLNKQIALQLGIPERTVEFHMMLTPKLPLERREFFCFIGLGN